MFPNPAIISHKYKLVYIPIQKVACSSIKRSLFPLFDFRDNQYLVHHAPFTTINYQEIDKDKKVGYFKFAFVRNPWSRLVSCYRAKIRKDPNFNNDWVVNGVHRGFIQKYGNTFYAGMDFPTFVECVLNIPDEEADLHFRSQHCSILVEGEIDLDFLGRFENIADDFSWLCERNRLPINLPYMRGAVELEEPPQKVDYRAYYDSKLIESVSRRFKKDIEVFGYSF